MVLTLLRCIFGLCSLGLGIIVLVAYVFMKGLRKPPGMLILWQTVLQIALDINWGVAGLYNGLLNYTPGPGTCEALGIFTIYCYFVGWNYNLCLISELIIKLKDPMNGNYKKRSPIYHIFSHSVGVAATLYGGITDEAGKSLIIYCFIKQES